jgi:hypothetical protein
MYNHIYIYGPIQPSEYLHTKNTSARRPVPHIGTKIGSPAYQKGIQRTYIHQGASITPPAAPPSGGGGGPPPPSPGGGGGTSCRTLLPRRQASTSHRGEHCCSSHYPLAMVAVIQYTAPGTPHPGCRSTCPQARPATPSPDDGVDHPSPLQLRPEEHVMALHQDHRTSVSLLPSWALQVTLQPHLVTASLHVEVSPALSKPDALYNSTLRPRGAKSAHAQNKQQPIISVSLYIII